MIGTLPFLAVLVSAFLHAAWNAALRRAADPGERLAACVMACAIVSVPGLAWTGLPDRAAWPLLAASLVANAAALRLSMAAYRAASFGLAYPIMRAATPLLALLAGAWLLGEWPRPLASLGVLLIAAAIGMLALAARGVAQAEARGLVFALLTAFANAAYVTLDAIGVRAGGDVLAYGFALAIGNGVTMALMGAAERRDPRRVVMRHAGPAFRITVASMGSFLLYLWAVSVTPVAVAAALRETSVLFALAMAGLWLKEPIGRFHWMAGGLAVAGVAAIRLA